MKHYLIEHKDIYFLCERIKEINSGYRLFYNTKENRFEIHNINQSPETFALSVDFVSPDIIEKLQKTRRERIAELIAEIDEENQKLEIQKYKDSFNKVITELKL